MGASREEQEFRLALDQLFTSAGVSLTEVRKHGEALRPQVNLGPSKVHSWRQGTAPKDGKVLAALVEYLQKKAGRTPNPYALEDLRRRAFARRNENRGGRPRKVKARTGGLGTPVAELHDPAAFDIHPVIESPAVSSETLTPYVERAHDRRLTDLLTSRGSCIVVVAGNPSTGKTRAVWEALRKLPPGWRMWSPATPEEALAEIEEAPALVPHTVIFLDDAHTYLHTPRERTGERLAVALRSLTNEIDRAPIVVVATIWKSIRDELTSEPSGARDPHAKTRALLSGHLVDVPDVFEGDDLEDAGRTGDPRMTEAAAKAPGGRLTQYLAGTLELERRYRAADELRRELIHVAMDTYRLGLGPMLTFTVLRDAVHGYVSAACQTDDASVRDALESLGESRRGTPGPLSPAPNATRPCYRLAEHLEQIGWAQRRNEPVAPALWEVLTGHAAPDELIVLGDAAVTRRLAMLGAGCYVRALRAGRAEAAERIGWMFERLERTDEALEWFGRAVELGVTEAAPHRISLLLRHGRLDDAIAAAEQMPAGDTDLQLALDLVAAGRPEDAMVWFERSFTAGRSSVATSAARHFHRHGYLDAAVTWFERSEDAGDPDLKLGAELFAAAKRRRDLLRVAHSLDAVTHIREVFGTATAVAWVRSHRTIDRHHRAWVISEVYAAGGDDRRSRLYREHAAEAGHPVAIRQVAREHEQNGRLDEALRWWMRLGESGHGTLQRALAILDELGREAEATAWLRARHAAGHGRATARTVARRLLATGKPAEAIEECRKLPSPHDAAELLWFAGHPAEAAPFYELALTTGEGTGFDRGEALERAGFTTDAITWYQQNSRHRAAVELLVRQGQADVAMAWLKELADSGGLDALNLLGELHEKAGELDSAVSAYRRAAAGGDYSANWRLARVLVEQGRVEEARAVYLRLAEAGDVEAHYGALKASPDWPLAERVEHHGLLPGGRIAPPWQLDEEFTITRNISG